MMEKYDFASGWKTVTGLVLLFAPVVNERFGIEVTPEFFEQLREPAFTLFATALTVFGLVMKVMRNR